MRVMEFYLALTRREGRHKGGSCIGITTYRGYLRLNEAMQPDLRRHARVARLVDDRDRDVEGVPRLVDAQLIHVRAGLWVLTGFERVEVDTTVFADFAQTWLLTPVGEVDHA